jgi:hypothetical protein
MNTSIVETAVLEEEIWRAWVQRGKRRDKGSARTARMLAGAAAVLLAMGSGFYFLAMR